MIGHAALRCLNVNTTVSKTKEGGCLCVAFLSLLLVCGGECVFTHLGELRDGKMSHDASGKREREGANEEKNRRNELQGDLAVLF